MDEKREIIKILEDIQSNMKRAEDWLDLNRQYLKKDNSDWENWESFLMHFVKAEWHISSALKHGYEAICTEKYLNFVDERIKQMKTNDREL